MPTYRCGPSVLRPDDSEQTIEPGAEFEHEFSAVQEAALIACGAIERVGESRPAAVGQSPAIDAAGATGDSQKE